MCFICFFNSYLCLCKVYMFFDTNVLLMLVVDGSVITNDDAKSKKVKRLQRAKIIQKMNIENSISIFFFFTERIRLV